MVFHLSTHTPQALAAVVADYYMGYCGLTAIELECIIQSSKLQDERTITLEAYHDDEVGGETLMNKMEEIARFEAGVKTVEYQVYKQLKERGMV